MTDTIIIRDAGLGYIKPSTGIPESDLAQAVRDELDGAAQKAENLADLASASTARANLGLGSSATHPSSDYQPSDPDLSVIAALDSTQSGAIASDGAGWLRKTYAQLKAALGLTKADVGLGNVDNTADSAKPVSTAQAQAIATALTSAEGYTDSATATVMHLDRAETATGAKDFIGGITKSGVPVATSADVSNAVATAIAGLSPAQAPADAQGSGLTHSGVGQTVGGVVITAGMRVLDTANSATAGLWVAASGAWTRPADFAHGANAQGKLVETDGGALWLCIATGAVTIDTTVQVWTEIDPSVIQAGSGLSKSGNTLSLALTKALVTGTGLTAPDVGASSRLVDDGTKTSLSGYTLLPWHSVKVDCTAAPLSIPLPPSPSAGDEAVIANVTAAGGNSLTVTGTGGPFTLLAGHLQRFCWNGSAWERHEGHKSDAALDWRYIRQATMPVNVMWSAFGAKGDGVTDDTVAWQAAIDAAQAASVGSSAVPEVVLPPGSYVLSGQISIKSCSLIGLGDPNTGVRVIWNGAAGVTVFQKVSGLPGGNSFQRFENMNLRAGSAVPGTWVDLTAETGTADVGLNWSRVHFGKCSGDAVKVGRWTNLHWDHMRWDSVGGFAIRATAVSSQNLASFVVDKFTYDNNGGTGGTGFLCIDNSAGASNLGDVVLSNARVELNIPWVGNKALVEVIESGTSRSVQIDLDHLTLAVGGTAGAGNSVIYRNSSDSSGHVALAARDLLFNVPASWTMVGGNMGSFQSVAPVANFDLYAMGKGQSAVWDLRIYGAPSGTSYPFQILKSGESSPRIRASNGGTLEFGPGGSTDPDVVLSRVAADALGLADGDSLAFGTGTGGKVGTASTQKIGFWGALPVVRPSVSGSRQANTALASLLTALAGAGLISDSSTLGVQPGDGYPAIVKSGSSYWHGAGTAFGTTQFTEAQLRVTPLYLPLGGTVAALGLEITTPGSAGSVYRVGVYGDSGGVPGTLLLDTGAIDTTQAAGFYSVTVNQVLDPGLYWVGAAPQGGAATVATIRSISAINYTLPYGPSAQSGSSGSLAGFSLGSQTGALSNWSGLTTAGSVPRVQLKVT